MSRPSKEQINGLVALVSQGRLEDALPKAEGLVQQFPDVPFILNLQGAINLGLGRLVQAAASYRKVLAIKPDHAQAHNNLGIALDQLGKPDEAVASYRKALEIKPDLAEAHANLGNVLALRHEIDEAIASYSRAIELVPGDRDTHTNLGNALTELERWPEAAASFFNALKLGPASAETHVSLGNALTHLDRWDEAAACYTQAIAIRPDYAQAHFNLGVALNHYDRWEEAIARYTRALAIKPSYTEAHYNLAGALDSLGRHEEAIASYDKTLELKPDYAEAYNNRGIVLGVLGKTDEARASYRKAIEIRPDFAEAHKNLSALTRYQPDDPHVGEMVRLIDRPGLSDQDRVELGFALGKAHDDFHDYDKAFAYFSEANRLQKQRLNYAISSARDRLADVKAAFSGPVPALDIDKAVADKSDQTAIFIVGMPRSGTTLVEQILASHSSVFGAGELKSLEKAVNALEWNSPTLTLAQIQSVRAAYRSSVARFSRAVSYITDKMPFNFWWIGFILTAMPEAKLVHVHRDARASCWSIFKNYFPSRGVGFSNDFEQLSEYYRIYIDLMQFWRERFPDQIYDLGYEALTENQRPETEKLLAYIGLPWEDHCLDFHQSTRAVRTLSANQVREKMYQGSSDEWRNYRAHLDPMVELLKDL
jgi:tetratricopeptide (TPR) repeat protein